MSLAMALHDALENLGADNSRNEAHIVNEQNQPDARLVDATCQGNIPLLQHGKRGG